MAWAIGSKNSNNIIIVATAKDNTRKYVFQVTVCPYNKAEHLSIVGYFGNNIRDIPFIIMKREMQNLKWTAAGLKLLRS